MSNDPSDLPSRPPRALQTRSAKSSSIRLSEITPVTRLPAGKSTVDNRQKFQLTEKQLDRVLDGGLQVAGGLLSITQEWMAIERIRAQSSADVAEIHERSLAVERNMRAEVQRIVAERDMVVSRGDRAITIIQSLMAQLENLDSANQQRVLEILTPLVTASLRASSEPEV